MRAPVDQHRAGSGHGGEPGGDVDGRAEHVAEPADDLAVRDPRAHLREVVVRVGAPLGGGQRDLGRGRRGVGDEEDLVADGLDDATAGLDDAAGEQVLEPLDPRDQLGVGELPAASGEADDVDEPDRLA